MDKYYKALEAYNLKVISINLGNAGSTGGIARNIKQYAGEHDVIVYTAYPDSKSVRPREDNDIVIGHDLSRRINRRLAVMTGLNGCFSFIATAIFLGRVGKINPDIIHLHNLHHSYINLPMLFKYLKNSKMKVVWTFHDCWPFTGQCAHFSMIKCDKWLTGCGNCPQVHDYPEAQRDLTSYMWKKKREWFTGLDNLHIVTPSLWLKKLVEKSFLGNYSVTVINNGIDLSVFRPTYSDFRDRYNCQNKKIVLGVAYGWGEKKGYDVFLRLASELPNEYQIVIVGNVGAYQKAENIVYIDRTHNQKEMVEIYSSADLFVNVTRQENFPTVNIEALACGTPVITFNTGGSPEIIDESCGIVVEYDDYDQLLKKILEVGEKTPFSAEACMKRAEMFSVENMLDSYLQLYENLK